MCMETELQAFERTHWVETGLEAQISPVAFLDF